MLNDLIAARKSCRICMTPGSNRLVSAASFSFDPDVVSHWSQWLGHPQPRLVVVGQDFSDSGYFEWHRGADNPQNATNTNLHRLLTIAGLAPKPPPERDLETPVHLTNAILCLENGKMNAPISAGWVRNCATNHLRPLIERLRPEIVVAMGSHGWSATRHALGMPQAAFAIGAAAGQSWRIDGLRVFAVGHCGPLGLVNRRWPQQIEDWCRIGGALSEGAGRSGQGEQTPRSHPA